jgi:peroxiredoxin Q/BCP
LQKDLKQIEDAHLQVVGISYDQVEVLKKFAERQKVTFPLLSDPDSKVITAYGILDKKAKGKTAGIPLPGTFIVDKEGVVRAKLFHEGFIKRHSTEELIQEAGKVK